MTLIYMGCMAALFVSGVLLLREFFPQKRRYVRFRVKPTKRLSAALRALADSKEDELFIRAGLHLSIARYSAIRNALALICLCGCLLQYFLEGVQGMLTPCLVMCVLYLLSWPTENFGKRRSPLRLLLDLQQRRHAEKLDDELLRITTQFKNLVYSKESCSSDHIIETLMRYTKLTRRAFAGSLSLLRLAKPEEAYTYFQTTVGTRRSADFAAILRKLDDLPPDQFLGQIEAFQSNLRQAKMTRQKKLQEAAGNRILALVSILLTVIMFDYMYIMFAKMIVQLTSI
ncbi:MAG: hypothetical protein PHQ50_01455 [Eubacteriales bacterium]|nr:hypothetical protein [Eubacteriales bacterium]MDD3350011.1 hypothetical protein [Eubacteriales bacterium]